MAKTKGDWKVSEHTVDEAAGMWFLSVERTVGDGVEVGASPYRFSTADDPRQGSETLDAWSSRVLPQQAATVLASLRADEPQTVSAGSNGETLTDLAAVAEANAEAAKAEAEAAEAGEKTK